MEKNNLHTDQTLGIAYENHKKGNLKLAKSLYEKILKIDSNNFEAIFLLGSLFLQTRNFQEAIRFLNKGIFVDAKVISSDCAVHKLEHKELGIIEGKLSNKIEIEITVNGSAFEPIQSGIYREYEYEEDLECFRKTCKIYNNN